MSEREPPYPYKEWKKHEYSEDSSIGYSLGWGIIQFHKKYNIVLRGFEPGSYLTKTVLLAGFPPHCRAVSETSLREKIGRNVYVIWLPMDGINTHHDIYCFIHRDKSSDNKSDDDIEQFNNVK